MYTYDVERILNWGCIVHWSKEVVFQRKDHSLFKEFITHQKLLTGTRNVSVRVFDAHTSVSSLLDLESHSFCEIDGDLNLLSWVNTRIGSSSENVKALVPDFEDHTFIL